MVVLQRFLAIRQSAMDFGYRGLHSDLFAGFLHEIEKEVCRLSI